MQTYVPIIGVSLHHQSALLEDGRTVPFQVMFDDDGEPTPDADLAVAATVHHPDGEWLILDLTLFHNVTLH
jgi:hypothetical protein